MVAIEKNWRHAGMLGFLVRVDLGSHHHSGRENARRVTVMNKWGSVLNTSGAILFDSFYFSLCDAILRLYAEMLSKKIYIPGMHAQYFQLIVKFQVFTNRFIYILALIYELICWSS